MKKIIFATGNADKMKELAKEEYKDLPDKFYGAWEDDKSAEELINEIRNSRVLGTRHIESFE